MSLDRALAVLGLARLQDRMRGWNDWDGSCRLREPALDRLLPVVVEVILGARGARWDRTDGSALLLGCRRPCCACR